MGQDETYSKVKRKNIMHSFVKLLSGIIHQLRWTMRVLSGLMSRPRFRTCLFRFCGLMWKRGTVWALVPWDGVCSWWMGSKLESVCTRPFWHGSLERGGWISVHRIVWGGKECLPLLDNRYGVCEGVVDCIPCLWGRMCTLGGCVGWCCCGGVIGRRE